MNIVPITANINVEIFEIGGALSELQLKLQIKRRTKVYSISLAYFFGNSFTFTIIFDMLSK